MADIVVHAESLGKKYVIGHEARQESYTALRDVIARGVRTFARKAKDMVHGRPVIEGDELEEVWALRDINFEIARGEVVGIIGRNGAGKSTLLKVLSRITEPTTGRVRIRGRVASLLEVGTGFHPELTGRENIFLNGAILGMSRDEIRKKFDEIVAFAEVERFLDTPVKRYSSGMYVRLAFAVAAHLEPEILIVDEVLSVGDAEFQDKCLGKMKAVAKGEGRTVLFVSHNMAAVSTLTTRAMLLWNGQLQSIGSTPEIVDGYLAMIRSGKNAGSILGKGHHTRIRSAVLLDSLGREAATYTPGEKMRIAVDFETDGTPGMSIELMLCDPNHQRMGISSSHYFYGCGLPTQPGEYRYQIELFGLWLATGRYAFDVATSIANVSWDHNVERALEFDVSFSDPEGRGFDFNYGLGFGAMALRAPCSPEFARLDAKSFGTDDIP